MNIQFLGALVWGITSIFKGGNIFGKIVSGIKKVGGFIFKGVKGLLHRRKNTALVQAARAFATKSKEFLVGKLYKFRRFCGLHLGRSSLATTVKRTWHKTKFWIKDIFKSRFSNIIHCYNDVQMNSHLLSPDFFLIRDIVKDGILNYTNSIISFVNYGQESLFYLEKISLTLQQLISGLERLATGQLSTSLLPSRILHKFLQRIL